MAGTSTGHKRRRRLMAVAAAAVLAAGSGPVGGRGEGVVYYQVVHTNRKIRDVSVVPETNEGIRRVVRISRVDGPVPGAAVHVVDACGVDHAALGRTVRKELHWDGKAWVLPSARRPPTATRPAPRSPVGPEQKRKAVAALEAMLAKEREALAVADQAVVQAARLVTEAKGAEDRKSALLLLSGAQAHRQAVLTRTVGIEALISRAKGLSGPCVGPAPVGAAGPDAPGRTVLAPSGPIAARRVMPHRQQVWKLPRGRGRRSYQVSMAHAEAGRLGGFHYVAYADTDGDGRPDTLIARSPLAVADRAGGWTRWSFTTDREVVFAGTTWDRPDAVQYCRPAGRADTGVADTEVFVSGFPWAAPCHPWAQPYLGNIHVRVGDQNPE